MAHDLLQQWNRLEMRLVLHDSTRIAQELIARYRERHRRYHGPAHLEQMLDLLDELDADPRLQIAAWFHDAVYWPGRSDNERSSAELARDRLISTGLSEADIQFVERAILATANHLNSDPVVHPLLDADLAVLGAVPEIYDRYRKDIREEYWKVPAFFFNPARARFLRSMLERPTIYYSPMCCLRFEKNARRNLQDELDQLQGSR